MKRLALLLALSSLTAIVGGPASAAPPKAQTAGGGVSMLCLNSKGTVYRHRTAPTECAHYGPGGAFGGGVNLKNLVWTGFGSPTATATGIECGFHLPCANIPVNVTVSRIRKVCKKPHRVYTQLSATSSFGTTNVKLTHCTRQDKL